MWGHLPGRGVRLQAEAGLIQVELPGHVLDRPHHRDEECPSRTFGSRMDDARAFGIATT
jgi:hypothetical protein